MSTVIPFTRAIAARQGVWSNQELAEFYRVEAALCRAGIAITSEHGLSDEGEPWFVFCQLNGEAIIHFARIDGSYVIASDILDNPVSGSDFRALIDEIARLRPDLLPLPRVSQGTKLVVHPASVLAALVAAAALSLSPDDAQASQGSGDEQPSPAGDAVKSAEPSAALTSGAAIPAKNGGNDQPTDRKQFQAMIFAAMAFASEAVASDHLGLQTDLDLIRNGHSGGVTHHAGQEDGLPGSDAGGGSSNGAGSIAQFASASGQGSGQQAATTASASHADASAQAPASASGEHSGSSISDGGHFSVGLTADAAGMLKPAVSAGSGATPAPASARSEGAIGSSSSASNPQGGQQDNSASSSKGDLSGQSGTSDGSASQGDQEPSGTSWVNGSGKTVTTGAAIGVINRGSDKSTQQATEDAQGDQSGNGKANGHSKGVAAEQAAASASTSDDSQGNQSDNDSGKANGHSKGATATQTDITTAASDNSQGDQSDNGNGKANGHAKTVSADQIAPTSASADVTQDGQFGHGNGKASHDAASASAGESGSGMPDTAAAHQDAGDSKGKGAAGHHYEAAPPGPDAAGDGNPGTAKGHGPHHGTPQAQHTSSNAHGADASETAGDSGSAGASTTPVATDASSAQPNQHAHQASSAQAQISSGHGHAAADQNPNTPMEHPADPHGGQAADSHANPAAIDNGTHGNPVSPDAASVDQAGISARPGADPSQQSESHGLHTRLDAPVETAHANDGTANRASKSDVSDPVLSGAESASTPKNAGELVSSNAPEPNSNPADHRAGGPPSGHVDPGVPKDIGSTHSLGNDKDQAAGLPTEPSGPSQGRSSATIATIDENGNLVFQSDQARSVSTPSAPHVADSAASHRDINIIGVSDHTHPTHDMFHHS